MKKFILVLTAIALIFSLTSQGQTKQREVGLVFNSLNNFGLTFRTGTEKGLWRFNTLYLSAGNTIEKSDKTETTTTNNGIEVKFGREWRKNITGNLEFRIGADISFYYNYMKADIDDKTSTDADVIRRATTYTPGINLVLGFNYVILKNFVIGVEMMPNFRYTTGTSTEKFIYSNNPVEEKSTISGIGYGISNSSVMLNLLYRFEKKK